jgi:hypothetical protein
VLATHATTAQKLLAAAPFVLLVASVLALAYVATGEYPNPGRKSRIAGGVVLMAVALVVWDITHWPIHLDN